MAYTQEYIQGKKLSEFISTNLIFLYFDINLTNFYEQPCIRCHLY